MDKTTELLLGGDWNKGVYCGYRGIFSDRLENRFAMLFEGKPIRLKILHCPLIGFWFDKIETGLKLIEYREVKPYWTKRLEGILPGDKIIFSPATPKENW